MLKRMLVVVALVAACGKSGGGDTGDKGAAASGDNTGVDGLFTGSAVALPAEVANATFGASEPEVKKALGIDSTYMSSKTTKGVSYTLGLNGKKLTSINIQTQTDLAPILTKLWGAPLKIKNVGSDKVESWWLSGDTGLRARLPEFGEGKVVQISAFVSVRKLIGDKGFDLAFAKGKPLLDATPEQLKAAWGDMMCDYDTQAAEIKRELDANEKDSLSSVDPHSLQLALCLPGLRTIDTNPARDRLQLDSLGKVSEITMAFPIYGSPDLSQKIVTQLDATFGKPTIVTTKSNTQRWYQDPASKTQVEATVDANYINVDVMRYLPFADFVGGADKPGLGIAGPHMPGGTFAQIKADDPDHFHQAGELASLIYPAPEFSWYSTAVNLDFNAGDANTYGYTVTIHHVDNDAAGDALFAALKAKFGEPKKDDAMSKPDDVYYNFPAKNGVKLRARKVSEQWQLSVTK